MGSRLYKLDDGTLVEVETQDNARQISVDVAGKIETTFEKSIKPVLQKTCASVSEAMKEIRENVNLEQVEIEMGLSFETEGNLYITKATVGANILVRMTLK
jgi:gamma-glutamylcysteine synthetase